MIGVLVNVATVLVGGLLGSFFKKGIPAKITQAIMIAVGGCILFIGIDGMLQGNQVLCTIIAMVLGALVGTLLDIDGAINRLGRRVEEKLATQDSGVGQGFVTGTLLFCIGSMAVVGSLNAGMTGDNQTLYAKSLLDLISATVMATSLGWGVCLSAFSVGVYQGAIALCAGFLAPLLSQSMINEITCTGSILIIFLSLNMIGLGKFKIANFLPAILFTPLVVTAYEWIVGLLA